MSFINLFCSNGFILLHRIFKNGGGGGGGGGQGGDTSEPPEPPLDPPLVCAVQAVKSAAKLSVRTGSSEICVVWFPPLDLLRAPV